MIKNVEDNINIRWLTPYLGTDNIPHGESAVYGILGSGEQTKIESCIIRIPESMVESHYVAHLTKTWTYATKMYADYT
jgi:hypothetical protein